MENVLRTIHAPFLFGRYRPTKIQGGIFSWKKERIIELSENGRRITNVIQRIFESFRRRNHFYCKWYISSKKNRDTELNEITCDITTIWKGDEGEDDFEVTDELTLRLPECNAHSLSVDFSVNKDDIIKWKKFLLAKGCCCLLKDNQYITTETE